MVLRISFVNDILSSVHVDHSHANGFSQSIAASGTSDDPEWTTCSMAS